VSLRLHSDSSDVSDDVTIGSPSCNAGRPTDRDVSVSTASVLPRTRLQRQASLHHAGSDPDESIELDTLRDNTHQSASATVDDWSSSSSSYAVVELNQPSVPLCPAASLSSLNAAAADAAAVTEPGS